MARDSQSGEAGRSASSDADLARRLDRLSRELEAEKQERVAAARPGRGEAGAYGAAFRLGSEFIAAVMVGAALGWALDHVAGTSPFGLIVLLLLGFAAGVVNVIRVAGGSAGAPTNRSDRA